MEMPNRQGFPYFTSQGYKFDYLLYDILQAISCPASAEFLCGLWF